MTDKAKAQGIERVSLSGENLAEQLRQSGVNQAYNMRLGPVTLRVEADTTTSYNDNINLDKTGRISDFVMTPSFEIHARWNITDINSLNLNLGIGYEMYLSHSQNNSLLVSPDSEAEFNFFIGDVALNVHDGFSYQQDPSQIGQLSNTTRLARFQNDAGISATWDLKDVVLSLNYDHTNFWVDQSVYSYLTNQSDTIAPKVTYNVDESIQAGLNTSFSDVRYEQSFQNDYRTYSAGPFVTAKISKNLSVDAQAGGYLSEYSKGAGNGDSENINSYYASAGVTHRINNAINESLTVGREFLPGLTSNFTERIYANYANAWQATPYIRVASNLWWENLNDSNATFRETSNRYGVGLNADDSLTEHLTLSLRYQYILKDANPSSLSYYQDLGTVELHYQF